MINCFRTTEIDKCIQTNNFNKAKQDNSVHRSCQVFQYQIDNTLCQFSSVQWLSHVRLFVTPCTGARQASLSITYSQSLPKLMSLESVMPSNHLILCHSFLLLPSVFPSIRVFFFFSELALRISWPKY